MLKNKDMQLSIYSVLYNKIPENHTLKILRDELDFSFINEILRKTYSERYGRPAKEPELMVKLLLLQNLYNLSDERVIEEASLNLAYLYFLGINPEDELPHPSLLTKFRKDKLGKKNGEEAILTMDEIMTEFIHQCVDKGIIEGTGISIDTTHTEANTFKCTAERVMKRLASKIFKTVEVENGQVPEGLNQEIPNYKEIEDHKEAKATMKSYLEDTITKVEESIDIDICIPSGNTIGRILEVGINTPEFYEYSQEQKTDEFKEKYKKRSCQEWKNGEMKNFHGLDCARGYGLKSMELQAKLTALAVNLKRIAAILSSKKGLDSDFIIIFLILTDENSEY